MKRILYQITKFLRAVTLQPAPYAVGIVLAGGSGSRMRSKDGTTKQRMLVCGEPMILHTLRAFDQAHTIREIILVAKEGEVPYMRALTSRAGFGKSVTVVRGGKTRAESARLGFEAAKHAKFVAIHDGARCLVTPELIDRVVMSAFSCKAATAAARVVDTVKEVDSNGYIKQTLDRDHLVCAETPQAFYAPLYRAAAYHAVEEGFSPTDDNALMERIGQCVRVVVSEQENRKVTEPDDLQYAEWILTKRKRKEKI